MIATVPAIQTWLRSAALSRRLLQPFPFSFLSSFPLCLSSFRLVRSVSSARAPLARVLRCCLAPAPRGVGGVRVCVRSPRAPSATSPVRRRPAAWRTCRSVLVVREAGLVGVRSSRSRHQIHAMPSRRDVDYERIAREIVEGRSRPPAEMSSTARRAAMLPPEISTRQGRRVVAERTCAVSDGARARRSPARARSARVSPARGAAVTGAGERGLRGLPRAR